MSDTEPDIFFVKYGVDFHINLDLLHIAAKITCERAGCEMKTFEYHGIIEAGPRPGESEGRRAHLWSALQGRKKELL